MHFPSFSLAAPRGSFPLTDNWLYVTIARGEAAQAGDKHGTLLLCDPVPLGYARAAEACAELTASGGDIARITPAKDAVCPMVYAPVTAQARGQWNGRPIEFRETFANSCQLAARTGPVFALDD